ncbi:MAG: hypothetical protein V4555_01785 [Acidobacteriota bacterium]
MLAASDTVGVNVATEPEHATVPATAVEPGPARLKVLAGEASVAQFIALLNVAVSTWVTGTPVAPFAGTVAITVGRTAVVKVQT